MTTIHTPRDRLTQPSGPANMPAPDPLAPCCYGSADSEDGTGCTCWTSVLDREATRDVQEGPSPIRSVMCGDCAYRPGSPEREEEGGDPPDYTLRQPFYCHTGMPRAVGYRHPALGDAVVPAPTDDDYRPMIRNGLAWQADGRPAVLCAGWAAHNGVKPRRTR